MKKILFTLLSAFVLVVFAQHVVAQSGVKGTVKDANTKETLVGATILVKGTTTGTPTDIDGKFELSLDPGSTELEVSFVGYDKKTISVNVKSGQMVSVGTVRLDPSAIGLGGISVTADRAKPRETPVAFSTLTKKEIEQQLGGRDIPLVMNVTPSVYATQGGGGAGDARINVRGFNQRNVAIMINGVPVNDMENGWVYWSNWDGVADATSSIQMQRGLSAVNLATPSIGGTMNILTSPADNKAGAIGKFEVGSGGLFKTTLSGHTGLINNKYAVSATLVRKVGNGIIDGTWTDAWAYYFGASYNINKNHRLEFYALGAPQRHGQNLYKQNIAAYSEEYARELEMDDSTIMAFPEASAGRYYNENWSPVSEDYDGKQWWNGKERDRYAPDFINERENYYHKPQVNMNLYSQWSDKVSQFTTIYYSGGTGGGTGTYGSVKWNYHAPDGTFEDTYPSRVVWYDGTIAANSDTAFGILRNSCNNQWTIGAISKVKADITDNFKVGAGVDWRTAEIEHFREVRDLLGGNFVIDDSDEFATDDRKYLGDKIAYYFTNNVNWLGAYVQAEFTNDLLSAYATYGRSMIKYDYFNHFTKAEDGTNLTAVTDWIQGSQLKGGLSVKFLDNFSVFGNFGLISKAPIFDNIIDDVSGTVAEDPQNEDFTAFEGGFTYSSDDDRLEVKANYYYTYWANRARNISVINQDGTEGFIFIQGMDQLHTGFEVDFNYRIIDQLGIGGMASIGNWQYMNDVTGTYKNYEGGEETIEYNFYVEGLKVGDAPQTQFAGWLNIFPIKGLRAQVVFRHYSKHFADWDPYSRTDEADDAQVWETPAYMLFDANLSYTLPLDGGVGVEIFGNIFNLLDEIYVQDAVDNSAYNGFYGYDNRFSHTANAAEVYLGIPRSFNAGLRINL